MKRDDEPVRDEQPNRYFDPHFQVETAKIPTASTPQAPQTPWTDTAPTGSSTPRFSKNHTDSTTTTPAMTPLGILMTLY